MPSMLSSNRARVNPRCVRGSNVVSMLVTMGAALAQSLLNHVSPYGDASVKNAHVQSLSSARHLEMLPSPWAA